MLPFYAFLRKARGSRLFVTAKIMKKKTMKMQLSFWLRSNVNVQDPRCELSELSIHVDRQQGDDHDYHDGVDYVVVFVVVVVVV